MKQQLLSALVAAQWQGDTALTLPLFWRQPTVSPVFFGRYPRSCLHSLALYPPPTPSPSLRSNLASVDVKQSGQVMPIISLSLVLSACMRSTCQNQSWNSKSLDPTGLSQLDPTGQSQLDLTGLTQLDPAGLSWLDPAGLSQLAGR